MAGEDHGVGVFRCAACCLLCCAQEDSNRQNSENMLVCQGTVVKGLKEEKTYGTAEIKWDRECLREGDSEPSWDKLMRSKWISNKHEQGTWWDNLHRMAKTAEDL